MEGRATTGPDRKPRTGIFGPVGKNLPVFLFGGVSEQAVMIRKLVTQTDHPPIGLE